jgi:threonine/homoserine/homoserine lactone efflux protein
MLFLIPGPAVLLTVSQTIKGGKKNGIYTGIGIAVGDLVHTIAAVLGLSAILMTSALAFEIVKYLGAAYLLYLGVTAIVTKSKNIRMSDISDNKGKNSNLSFRQALFVELLNPKTALFFLAFLPQFVRNDGSSVTLQLLMLGLIFVLMSIAYTTLLVFLTSIIGDKFLVDNKPNSAWSGKLVGLVYIGLAFKLVLQTQK